MSSRQNRQKGIGWVVQFDGRPGAQGRGGVKWERLFLPLPDFDSKQSYFAVVD